MESNEEMLDAETREELRTAIEDCQNGNFHLDSEGKRGLPRLLQYLGYSTGNGLITFQSKKKEMLTKEFDLHFATVLLWMAMCGFGSKNSQ